jgi:hypothetical protein
LFRKAEAKEPAVLRRNRAQNAIEIRAAFPALNRYRDGFFIDEVGDRAFAGPHSMVLRIASLEASTKLCVEVGEGRPKPWRRARPTAGRL